MRLNYSDLISLALIISCSTPLCAQSNLQKQEPQPVFKANARAVVVDVVVTNGKGEPVNALPQQNFRIKEDGKPQAIDFFEEHAARILPPGAIPQMPAMPANVYTDVPPVPQSDSVNVVLLDSLNTSQQDQVYVHKQIKEFFEKMAPGTRVAIFMLGSELRFVQGFTSDSSLLLAAINSRRNASPERDWSLRLPQDDMESAQLTSMMMQSGASGLGSSMAIEAILEAQEKYDEIQLGNRIAMTLEALDYLARYLGGVPGRKNLIWFSSSFPVSIFPTYGQKDENTALRVHLSQMKKTADLLTLARVAVYPVGAQGVMTEHVIDADSAGTGYSPLGPAHVGNSGGGSDTIPEGSPMAEYRFDASRRADTITSMEQLAATTGGKPFFNTNDLNVAMEQAIQDGAHYYTLIYTPTNKKLDGQFRHIEVKLAEGQYKLAYRQGYNADDTVRGESALESNPLHPLMKHGMPGATQILFGVRIVPVVPQPAATAPRAGKNTKLTGPVTRYSADFMIRWTDLKLAPTPQGTHSGKIQVELLAFGRDGQALNWTGGTQVMNLSAQTYAAIERSGIPAHLEIDVPAKTDVYLAAGLYDWNTGKAGTLEIPLHAAAAADTASQHPSPKSN
jgi:VWFA-related protein